MGTGFGVDQGAQRFQRQRAIGRQCLQCGQREMAALQGHRLAALQVLEPTAARAQQHPAPVGPGHELQRAVGQAVEAAAGGRREQPVHHVIGRQRCAQHMHGGVQRHAVQRGSADLVGHQQRAAAGRRRADRVTARAAAGGQQHRVGRQRAAGPVQAHAAAGRLVRRRHLGRDAFQRDALGGGQRGGGGHRVGQEVAIAPPWQVALGLDHLSPPAQPGDEGLPVVRQQAQGVGGVVEQVIGALVAPVRKAGAEVATGLEHGDALHRAAVDQLQQGRRAGEAAADDGHMGRPGCAAAVLCRISHAAPMAVAPGGIVYSPAAVSAG